MKYVNEVRGYNSRLDSLQSAALRVKLQHLDRWNEARREIARCYLAGLAGAGLILPVVPEWANPVWHLFVIRHPHRDLLQRDLAEAGIATMIHYPISPHLQEAYSDLPVSGRLPIAECLQREVLSLPMHPRITAQEREYVCRTIKHQKHYMLK